MPQTLWSFSRWCNSALWCQRCPSWDRKFFPWLTVDCSLLGPTHCSNSIMRIKFHAFVYQPPCAAHASSTVPNTQNFTTLKNFLLESSNVLWGRKFLILSSPLSAIHMQSLIHFPRRIGLWFHLLFSKNISWGRGNTPFTLPQLGASASEVGLAPYLIYINSWIQHWY